jgi:hypothetical protein
MDILKVMTMDKHGKDELDGIAWPKQYLSQHPRALAVRENG